jgi:rhodanese-related sulfurtransferase
MVTMEIVAVPAFSDNYIWLVHDAASGETAVVDPGDAAPALAAVEQRGWTIGQIWNTHWHPDHTGGNLQIKETTGARISGPARGRIPGATFLHGGPHALRLEHYTDEQGVFHPLEQVRRTWAQSGVDGSRPVVFYCGTGWRASVAFLFAQALGFRDISVYDGGWSEWSASASTAR